MTCVYYLLNLKTSYSLLTIITMPRFRITRSRHLFGLFLTNADALIGDGVLGMVCVAPWVKGVVLGTIGVVFTILRVGYA